MEKRIVAVDLFCGCGGLTKGLTDAGIHVVKGIDIDKTVKDTYEKNNPGSAFVECDVRKLSVDELMYDVDRNGKDLLLAGCAPCQPFSAHRRDSRHDDRRSLMRCFSDFVEKLNPEHILVENVPGFQKSYNQYHSKFIRTLEKMNYTFDERVINAANYGVPQIRLRYVLVGSKKHPVKIPMETHDGRKRKFKTVRETIKKYPRIKAGQSHGNIPNHSARNLSDINLQRITLTPNNGGSRKDVPKEMGLKCHKDHRGHTDVYGRMYWDRPSPTLTCKCNSLSNGRFGHPTQNRAISVREAASLQTFPDDYIFYSYNTRNAMHIGNSVPVLLAKTLGKVFTRIK